MFIFRLLAIAASILAFSLQPILAAESKEPADGSAMMVIEAVAFSPEDPVPGQTVALTATIRNTSGDSVSGAELRFFQDGVAIGDPVSLNDVPAGGVTTARLAVRPSGVGRFSFSAVPSSGERAGIAPPGHRATAQFTINRLPGWWKRLDKELAAAHAGTVPASRSVMPALAGHGNCRTDIRTKFVLQRHGEALLAGIRALPTSRSASESYFLDAVAALSEFSAMLYCVDLDQVGYWDRAIAGFWRSIIKNPEADMNFQAAVIATWNPALMVLDAIQFTGHSEIAAAYQDLAPDIDKALALYPVDSYGAAWLDAFGTGQLIRHAGAVPAANLTEVLRGPGILGLGTCPLSVHAGKAVPDAPCLERLAEVTKNCTATGVSEILAGLNETGMLMPLLHGNFAAEAAKAGLPPGHAVSVPGDKIGTFGTALAARIPVLCSALRAAGQAGGLQGMAEALSGPALNPLDGCTFAIAEAGLGDARQSADRALQCISRLGWHTPRSPIPAATQVRFPSACSLSDTSTADAFHRMGQKLYHRQINDQGASSVYSKTDSLEAPFRSRRDVDFSDGSSEAIGEERQDGVLGPLTRGSRTATDTTGETVFQGSYDFDPKTGQLIKSVETRKLPNGNTQTTERVRGADGKMRQKVTERDPEGNKVSESDDSQPKQTRPVDPEGSGCPETAAQARAMAMFNCFFAEDTTELSGRAGLGPLINVLGPDGPLPAQCDALDPRSFWGSTTGAGVTDPVPWAVSGGPAIFETFIPRVDGVIDPPKDWTSVPRPPGLPE